MEPWADSLGPFGPFKDPVGLALKINIMLLYEEILDFKLKNSNNAMIHREMRQTSKREDTQVLTNHTNPMVAQNKEFTALL